MMITDVIFDLGNVIVDLDIPRAEAALRNLGVSFLNAEGEDLEHFLDLECGRISEEVFINYLIKRAKPGTQARDVINAWNAMLVDIPLNRLHLMDQIKQQYGMFILSNTNSIHLQWVAHYLHRQYDIKSLDQFAHRAFYSNEMGTRKPEKEIFLQVLKSAGIQAERTIFFDDHPENIAAAKSVGIEGILIDPTEEIVDIVPRHIKLENRGTT